MFYHEDLVIPGKSPFSASSRKQIRHKLKSRIYPRFRPQRQQRRIVRVLNLGVLLAFAINAFLAILFSLKSTNLCKPTNNISNS